MFSSLRCLSNYESRQQVMYKYIDLYSFIYFICSGNSVGEHYISVKLHEKHKKPHRWFELLQVTISHGYVSKYVYLCIHV